MASPKCPRSAPRGSESTTRRFSSNWGSLRPTSTACGRRAPSRKPDRRRESIAAKEEVTMSVNPSIQRIGVVGTGVIGASWATYYLSRGFDVVATDPAPTAEAHLRKYVANAWTALARAGLAAGASADRLTFNPQMDRALAEVDFVQENAPERPEFKVKLFAQMDAAAPPSAILASSSSGIPMDVIQADCKHPERTVIGHPFNPPHIVPLVEVVGGAKTSEATIDRALAFYAAIGKKPIRLHK